VEVDTISDIFYERIIGVGGLGTGRVFSLLGNETLGRNESRAARLEPVRDYCKLHNILHYVAKLLQNRVKVMPIGLVGNDPTGLEIIECMNEAGMDTRFVSFSENPTMSAFCFLYPDGDGGNVIASNSACEDVSEDYINDSLFSLDVGRETEAMQEMVLVAPEIPFPSRVLMLEMCRKRGSFIAVSFARAEAAQFSEYLSYIDLLAINLEEARALANAADDEPPENVAIKCNELFKEKNPRGLLIVTLGADGVFACGKEIKLLPAPPVSVVSTAGAGDALLGGTIAALAFGLPFLCDETPFDPLSSAVEIGILTAAIAVQSPDTIAFDLDLGRLRGFAKRISPDFSDCVSAFFDSDN
jgi:sugar/nucleoside kinase (ribokinase family)